MSYTASLFHIVFGTKDRKPTISLLHKEELRRYIYGIADKLNCDIICVNMMAEHVHILADLRADVSLSKFVGTIKQSSSLWLKGNIHFSTFEGWAKEYYGVAVSPSNKESVKGYIDHQEQHHQRSDFVSEMKWMVGAIGKEWYENSFV